MVRDRGQARGSKSEQLNWGEPAPLGVWLLTLIFCVVSVAVGVLWYLLTRS